MTSFKNRNVPRQWLMTIHHQVPLFGEIYKNVVAIDVHLHFFHHQRLLGLGREHEGFFLPKILQYKGNFKLLPLSI